MLYVPSAGSWYYAMLAYLNSLAICVASKVRLAFAYVAFSVLGSTTLNSQSLQRQWSMRFLDDLTARCRSGTADLRKVSAVMPTVSLNRYLCPNRS